MFRQVGYFFKNKLNQPLKLIPASVRLLQTEKVIPADLETERKPDLPLTVEKNPFEKEKPKCVLCKYDVKLDYKNVRLLSQFVSSFTGKIYGRHITGLCERQQKLLENAVKKSRACGLMPYYNKDPIYIRDPLLFDPERPFRPHKY